MQSSWLKGIPKESYEARVREIKSYQNAFDALLEMLVEEEGTTADYDKPSWAYLQADRNGYNRAIRYIRKLISNKE